MYASKASLKLALMAFAIGIAIAHTDLLSAKTKGPASPCHQHYPNIEGEVLLENDKVVVQRFIFPPGQWEGVHSHPPDQLYIHLKGGAVDRPVRRQGNLRLLRNRFGWLVWSCQS